MTEAWIIDACRTPRGVGKVGKGALAHLHPQRVGATVLKAIAERNELDTSTVDDIIWSTSNQSNTQGSDLGRMAALDAGFDVRASGVTLDRFCGGGITSSNLAAGMILSGLEDVIIAGGTDMMSTYGPNRHPNAAPFIDAGNEHLRALHPQPHQGVCADAIADAISQEIINLFDAAAPDFYNDIDRTEGFIMGKDRQGNITKAGLLSISIGIVSNAFTKITHVAQIGEIGAELKKFAKAQDKSNFVRDKRKTESIE